MPTPSDADALSDAICVALGERGVTAIDEVSLRAELERRLPSYTLYRLTPAAAKRWKCKYRLMYGDTYVDCQTVAEAYARALLSVLASDAGP
jgi:hypothetical protein